MSLKTYGDKPVSFQLEDGGEFYFIGSEVFKEKPVFYHDIASTHYQFLII